jgi:hypothetical protein
MDIELPESFEAWSQWYSESDRGAALVGSALVESTLRAAIRAHMVPGDVAESLASNIFGETGALGAFGVQIEFGFLLGLYSDGVRRDLKIIQKIRNRFAHQVRMKSFDVPEIKDRCANLKVAEKHVFEASDIYGKGKPIAEVMAERGVLFLTQIADGKPELKTARGQYLLTVRILHQILMTAALNPRTFREPFDVRA